MLFARLKMSPLPERCLRMTFLPFPDENFPPRPEDLHKQLHRGSPAH